MSGLFSHPPVGADVAADRPDIRVSVSVPVLADHAWAGLTEHLHLWWPAELLSRWGDDSFFDLEDNALVETSAQEEEYVWGEVSDSVPGGSMLLAWRHAGSTSSTDVRLEMSEGVDALPPEVPRTAETEADGSGDLDTGSDDGTALVLTHSGWTSAEPQELYELYREFWPAALARYRRFMGGS